MTDPLGIERINVYPTTGALSIDDLCRARGMDFERLNRDLMVEQRSVGPCWEDAVTMAVNAAKPLLDDIDRERIGLLIVGSETGVDQEKPISSWVHRFLDLSPNCRNFEVKHACYGTTGGVQMALAWLASGLAGDRTALVINTDQSLLSIGKPWEPVTGAASVAMLLSREPRLVAYDLDSSGYFSSEISDVMRPSPRVETGNRESSLISYLEALEGAFEHYQARGREAGRIDDGFDWNVYHMPFAGMAFRAHRALLRCRDQYAVAEARADFEKKVAPSTTFIRRLGGVYGASTFIGLLGLADDEARAGAGGRGGIFAFGSGSCAEFQSARLLPDAAAVAAEAGLRSQIDARRPLSVEEYEAVERERDASIMAPDFAPDLTACEGWYENHYEGRGLLVLEEVKDYYRTYGWS